MEANEAMPRGYDPLHITEPPTTSHEEMADRILLGLRLRAVARRALKMGTVAAIAAGILTGASIPASSSAQAAMPSKTRQAAVAAMHDAEPDPIPTRLPSRFGAGRWTPIYGGDVYVSAPLYVRTNVRGWIPNVYTIVRVEEMRCGRWYLLKRLRTNRYGVASGYVHTGSGPRTLRVRHNADLVSVATTGRTRFLIVPWSETPPEPFDVN